jgi:hypothetical protein
MMMKPLLLFAVVLISATAGTIPAQTLEFTSSEHQTTLIELFTSEGCSSCPPADRWMSRLKNDPRLWQEFIPLAFHVDYWDYLGWRDPLSQAAFSRRQRQYAQLGYARSVYTPGFFSNGREWRGWFKKPRLGDAATPKTGILKVNLSPQTLTANYQPVQVSKVRLQLHVAVLGFDIRSSVTSGENSGKTLTHDFVVLAWLKSDPNLAGHWQIKRETLDLSQNHARALAVWVTAADDPAPLQATGGWLDTMPD